MSPLRLPNFLIIGAHKAGTSSLYRYLKQHPDVYMPPRKEVRYFSYDPAQGRTLARTAHEWGRDHLHWVTTWEDYLSLFRGAAYHSAIGEASAEYLNTPGCAKRIHDALPRVRLIASIRNPVDRAYSLYFMAKRTNPFLPSFSEILESGGRLVQSAKYYDNLLLYFEHFDRKQIKIILAEDLRYNSEAVTKDLFRFLNVDEGFVPDVSVKYNTGGIPRSQRLHRIVASTTIRRVRPYVPELVKTQLRTIRNFNLATPPVLTADERRRGLDLFREDIVQLQDLIQIDLSRWLQTTDVSTAAN